MSSSQAEHEIHLHYWRMFLDLMGGTGSLKSVDMGPGAPEDEQKMRNKMRYWRETIIPQWRAEAIRAGMPTDGWEE